MVYSIRAFGAIYAPTKRSFSPQLQSYIVRRDMSKKMLSTALLFLIGAGFALFSLYTLLTAKDTDTVIVGLVYLVPAIAAFVALIMLPFKPMAERE